MFSRARKLLKYFFKPARPKAPTAAKVSGVPELAPVPAPALAPAIIPRPGQWLSDVFVNFAGMRNFRLYVPGSYSGRKLPLVVMLHGCQQSPEDFAAGTHMNFIAEKYHCFVAYPGQSSTANGMGCWNWFNPRNQHRGRGEPSIIAGITRQIMSNYAIDPGRVYIAGLSAGGAMTAIMAATYPDLYAAAGVHSGLARGAARSVSTAYRAMQRGEAKIAPEVTITPMSVSNPRLVPMIVFHGDNDETVNLRNSEQVLTQARPDRVTGLKEQQSKGRVKAGRRYTRTAYLDKRDRSMLELWVVHDSGHAWSGGKAAGSYTDPLGPDASLEMMKFFLSHQLHTAKAQEEVFS